MAAALGRAMNGWARLGNRAGSGCTRRMVQCVGALIEQTKARRVGTALGISEPTVRSHLQRAREVAGVHYVAQLVWWMTEKRVFDQHGVPVRVRAAEIADVSRADVRCLAEIIRCGTYEEAARALGVSASAVYHRMYRIWTRLGLVGQYQVIWWATHTGQFERLGVAVELLEATTHVTLGGEPGSGGIVGVFDPGDAAVSQDRTEHASLSPESASTSETDILPVLSLACPVPGREQARRIGLLKGLQREGLSDLDKSDALRAYRESSGLT